MKHPLHSDPKDVRTLDQWLAPKITSTSRDFEEAFAQTSEALARFRQPQKAGPNVAQTIPWRNMLFALGTMAALLTGAFVAFNKAAQTSYQLQPQELAEVDSLFELDAQLGPAMVLLDPETFDALVYISHETNLP
jgi:hypothetical protein